jgi:UDP-2,3-diacylglucosamine hydrolase
MQLFLSDLHLEHPNSAGFVALRNLLHREARRCNAIYFLGDLTEVWVGDDDDGPLATALLELLKATTRHCAVHIMHGNRDFLFGSRFCEQTGATLISDPTLLDADTLLAHGDAFCIDDQDYQQLRNAIRGEQWQQQILARSLNDRRELARAMRQQSQQANANKAANIMDVNAAELERVMQTAERSVLIHGHTHRPGVHQHSWGIRYVLGAWENCGWLLRRSAAHCQLECFPLSD